jgi:hypothetical protein
MGGGAETTLEAHGEIMAKRKEGLMKVVRDLGVPFNEGEMRMAMNAGVYGGVEMEDLPPYLVAFRNKVK